MFITVNREEFEKIYPLVDSEFDMENFLNKPVEYFDILDELNKTKATP